MSKETPEDAYVEEGNQQTPNDELEDQLCKLRNMYMEMKKERVKTEKDTNLLENKLKMLQMEELKAFKKMNTEKKSKEEWEQARQRTIEFRNQLNEVKFKRKQETEENKQKFKDMREQINKNLNDKKLMKFQENRLNNLQMKQKKIVIFTYSRKMKNS